MIYPVQSCPTAVNPHAAPAPLFVQQVHIDTLQIGEQRGCFFCLRDAYQAVKRFFHRIFSCCCPKKPAEHSLETGTAVPFTSSEVVAPERPRESADVQQDIPAAEVSESERCQASNRAFLRELEEQDPEAYQIYRAANESAIERLERAEQISESQRREIHLGLREVVERRLQRMHIYTDFLEYNVHRILSFVNGEEGSLSIAEINQQFQRFRQNHDALIRLRHEIHEANRMGFRIDPHSSPLYGQAWQGIIDLAQDQREEELRNALLRPVQDSRAENLAFLRGLEEQDSGAYQMFCGNAPSLIERLEQGYPESNSFENLQRVFRGTVLQTLINQNAAAYEQFRRNHQSTIDSFLNREPGSLSVPELRERFHQFINNHSSTSAS